MQAQQTFQQEQAAQSIHMQQGTQREKNPEVDEDESIIEVVESKEEDETEVLDYVKEYIRQ